MNADLFPWPRVDAGRLRAHRTAVVGTWMRENGVDHLVLTGPDQIRYACDYRAQLVSEAHDWFAAVVDSDGVTDVFVPSIDTDVADPDETLPQVRALHPLPSWSPAACQPAFWTRALAAELTRRGARRIAYDNLDGEVLRGLRADLPGATFLPAAAALFTLRQVKHPLEIELIQATCRVNTLALVTAVETAKPGMTDHDLLATAADHQHRSGVEFLTHSVCNVRKGSGDWFATGAQLREGEPFFIDIGCHGPGGYASDLARTGFLGTPAPAVSRAWQHLLTAHELAQEAVRPGVKASHVQGAVNAYLRGHGLPVTPYSVGHGVGLRICELPLIYSESMMDHDATFEAGQVIALEPETAVEVGDQRYVLKIEDNFVVTDQGVRLLSELPAHPWPTLN
jgi:Xaa-Pro aminopeptidase